MVGFLNTNDSGLLVLGIKTRNEVADKIVGVERDALKQLKTEISLEDFLKEKVKSVPSFLNVYDIQTKIVNYKDDRDVVFIEVMNRNWDRIYYSDLTQYVYIRKAKSTEPVPLIDTLKLIAERSYPQVYSSFEEFKPIKLRSQTYLRSSIYITNEGVKATDKIHSFVLIGSDDETDIEFLRGDSASLKRLDPENHGLNDFIRIYQHRIIHLFIFPDRIKTDRIYPFNKHPNGQLNILEKDISKIKKIIVLNIEDSGFVKQEFKVSTNEDTKFFEETKREFKPYLTV